MRFGRFLAGLLSLSFTLNGPSQKLAGFAPPREEIRSRTFSLTARDLPLKEILIQAARAVESELELDVGALKRAGIDLDHRQSVLLKDVEFETAIQTILNKQRPDRIALDLRFEDGVINVSTQEARRDDIRLALPEWLRAAYDGNKLMVDLDEEKRIEAIHDYGVLTDDLLAHVPTLTKLRDLEIHGPPKFTIVGIVHLAKLEMLEKLELKSFRVAPDLPWGDEILRSVAGVKTLRTLILHDSGITAAGLEHLAKLPRLTTLKISHEERLTDEAVTSIVKLQHLRTLNVNSQEGASPSGMRFPKESIRQLTTLHDLEHLNLNGHEFSKETLWSPHRKSLELRGLAFDAAMAQEVSFCRELTKLDLNFQRVTDDAFEQLSELPISDLRVRCTTITDEALSHLQCLPQLSSIHLWTYGLTDRSLESLAEMKSMTSLSLNWQVNRFSAAGLKQLAVLPNLHKLELRIVPFSGGAFFGVSLSQLREKVIRDEDQTPSELVRSHFGLERLKQVPIDLDEVAEALPNARIHPSEDEFDNRK